MKKSLTIKAIQTPLFKPQESLEDFIIQSLSSYPVKEETVIACTSKLFSLAENRFSSSRNKEALIKEEADLYIGQSPQNFHLTIKEGLLMPSAGIDQSNSPTGEYLLLPKDPYGTLKNLWKFLKSKWNLKSLGLLMTDSHTTPLRRGVTGVAMAHAGFQAIQDLRGQKDLYGKKLQVTTINHLDALAAAAVWMMGEGDDLSPLAVIEEAHLQFTDCFSKKDIRIPMEEDLYQPLFKNFI